MNKATWVVFDIGDVLLNWQKSATMLSLELGVERDKLLTCLFRYADDMLIGKLSAIDGWSKVIQDLGVQAEPTDLIHSWRSKENWFDEPLELIEQLHGAGYKLAIMANSWLGLSGDTTSVELPYQLRLFSQVFESSQLAVKKPGKAFYRLVEQELRATDNEIILVDDGLANVTVAAGLGWQTFHFVAEHASADKTTAELKNVLLG